MADNYPPVTVVMPAHNVEEYIGAAIQSILNQTFKNFKLWILENGSTDKTLQKAREFSDERIEVFELGQVGFQGALSFALENVKSKWIARMDGDDICLPTRLEKQMSALEKNPDYVMVGTAGATLTPFGSVITPFGNALSGVYSVQSRELNKRSVAIGLYRSTNPAGRFGFDPSMIFNRKVALDVGGYDPEFSMGDVPLWLRMLDGRKGWELTEVLYLHRVLPKSLSRSNSDGIKVRAKYAPEYMDEYLSVFGLSKPKQQQGNDEPATAKYWKAVVLFELLSGKYGAAMVAANKIKECGGSFPFYIKEKFRASTRGIGNSYYTKKFHSFYCHRADIDKMLQEQGYRFLEW